jgi:hypothetical protein
MDKVGGRRVNEQGNNMAASDTGQLNQRVTNARIFAKLESMEKRLEQVEISTGTSAAHSIRCAEKWDAHDRLETIQRSSATNASNRASSAATIASGKQLAIIAGVVAVVVAVINLISLAIQGML